LSGVGRSDLLNLSPKVQSASVGVAIRNTGAADALDVETPVETANPLSRFLLRDLAATRERPLFSPLRRPPVDPVTAAPPPVAAAPQVNPVGPEQPPFALIGTIVSEDRKIAIVLNRDTQTVTVLREGHEGAGWRITAISARSAIAKRNGTVSTLSLPRLGDPAGLGLAQVPNAQPTAINSGAFH
jgi:general secretion pathway protein N